MRRGAKRDGRKASDILYERLKRTSKRTRTNRTAGKTETDRKGKGLNEAVNDAQSMKEELVSVIDSVIFIDYRGSTFVPIDRIDNESRSLPSIRTRSTPVLASALIHATCN